VAFGSSKREYGVVRISPHLCFDGQCRLAFDAYKKILGGNIVTMLTYGDSPMAPKIDPKWHARIVHATLDLGEVELTGVDILPPNYQRPQGFFVTVTFDDPDEARRVFTMLADGGGIHLDFQRTFWTPGFGVLIDKFGVPWEISSAQEPQAA
jgi:PhnB protein